MSSTTQRSAHLDCTIAPRVNLQCAYHAAIMSREIGEYIGRNCMKTETISIQGMTCNHCAMRVMKALKGVVGVLDAKVDQPNGNAVVTFDETRATAAALCTAVTEAGYKVI